MPNDIPVGKQSLEQLLKESVDELKKEGNNDFVQVQKLLDGSAKRKRVGRKHQYRPGLKKRTNKQKSKSTQSKKKKVRK